MLLLDVSLAYFCQVATCMAQMPSHLVMLRVDVDSDQVFYVNDGPFVIREEQFT